MEQIRYANWIQTLATICLHHREGLVSLGAAEEVENVRHEINRVHVRDVRQRSLQVILCSDYGIVTSVYRLKYRFQFLKFEQNILAICWLTIEF